MRQFRRRERPLTKNNLLTMSSAAAIVAVSLAVSAPVRAADEAVIQKWIAEFQPSTLLVMTYLASVYPEAERVGMLSIPTTRGDRLFISLITAAVIHLVWIGVIGTDTIATLPVGEEGYEISSLWLASGISLVTAVLIFRTV